MPLGEHTLLLTVKEGLLAFGCNFAGQLGLGHTNSQWDPEEVPWEGPAPFQVDWGGAHSLVLDEEGCVWEAGLSRCSCSFLTFQRVPELPIIILISAGNQISAALDKEGVVWVWTSSSDLPWASSTPKPVEGLPWAYKVACGDRFLVAEANDCLWLLGNSKNGQLGLGSSKETPFQLVGHFRGHLRCLKAFSGSILAIGSDGSVYTAGDNSKGELGRTGDSSFQSIPCLPPMRQASCGYSHALALDEQGSVWSWGSDEQGQLGTSSTSNELQPLRVLKRISMIVAGESHSLVYKEDGTLIVFGDSCFGQLGPKCSYILPTVSTLRGTCGIGDTTHPLCNRSKSARSIVTSNPS
jgi:alpha-tubulin suppressor-like RCC1 family protein